MPTTRDGARTLAALLWLLGVAGCASGGTVGETTTTSSGPGVGGGSVGRGGGGADDDDDDTSSSKSSASSSDGGASGDGGATSDGGGGGDGGGGPTGATTTSGTGAPCAIDADCSDGDPCTVDTCGGVAGCVQTQVPTGQTGTTTEGPVCDGVCQTDGACGLSLYTRTFAAGQPFSRQALSQAWTGPDAPPPRGIAAVEKIYQRDALYVFTDDGQTYRRIGGAWQPPAPTATMFPGLEGTEIDCAMSWQPEPAGVAYMYFHTSGVARYAWSYSIDAAYEATLAYGPFAPVSGGGPPYGQYDCDVSFVYQYAYSDTQPWLDQWEGFDGSLWSFDGALATWVAHGPQATSPVWGNMPGGPAPGTTRDVFIDGTTLGFVAP